MTCAVSLFNIYIYFHLTPFLIMLSTARTTTIIILPTSRLYKIENSVLHYFGIRWYQLYIYIED